MAYLGNPKMVMMTQDSMPIANYEYPTDPTPTTNPTRVPASWLNTVTGVVWVCTDNTTDANVWKGGFRGALVYNSAVQALTTGVETYVVFDLEEYDTSGFHDNVTNNTRFTIPAGVSKVKLMCNVAFIQNATGVRMVKIFKNNAAIPNLTPIDLRNAVTTAYDTANSVNTPVLSVSEGDYFEVKVLQTSGGNLDLSAGNNTFFAIEVVE